MKKAEINHINTADIKVEDLTPAMQEYPLDRAVRPKTSASEQAPVHPDCRIPAVGF